MKPPPELRALVRKWQILLNLKAWTLRLDVSKDDASETGGCAAISTDSELRRADITFYQSAFDEDMEETVIHELLHLHFASFRTEPETAARDLEEHAIYAISKCLARMVAEIGE
jgi:hypothetical protein